MKAQRVFFVFILLSISFQISFGQEFDFPENWFRDIKGFDDFNTRYNFKFYTKGDVVKARGKFKLIESGGFTDEWEGVYTRGTILARNELHWNTAGGFVYFSYYHGLNILDFGNAINNTDSVKLASEKSPAIPQKPIYLAKLIKVTYGDNHYLVPENRLSDFAERAVGLSPDLEGYGYYLYKIVELGNEVFGLPIFPDKYRHFLRLPIKTQIIQIGERVINQNKFDDGTINYEEIYRFVTLGAGKDKKVKVKAGMNFFVEGLGEWVEITKVMSNSSIGRVRRDFDENGQENCRESELGYGIGIPCQEIKVGMKVRTKVSELYF